MKHNIILSGQFGFRTNHSTAHALLLITDKLHRELLKMIIFRDHSKAFDAVDHNMTTTTTAVKTSVKKMNLRSLKLNRVYLDPLNMSNAGDFSWS